MLSQDPKDRAKIIKQAKDLKAQGFLGGLHLLFNQAQLVLPSSKRGNPLKGPSEIRGWFKTAMGVEKDQKPKRGPGQVTDTRQQVVEEARRLLDEGFKGNPRQLRNKAQLVLPEKDRWHTNAIAPRWFTDALSAPRPAASIAEPKPAAEEPAAPAREPAPAPVALNQDFGAFAALMLDSLINRAKSCATSAVQQIIVEALRSPEGQAAIRSATGPQQPIMSPAPVLPTPAPAPTPAAPKEGAAFGALSLGDPEPSSEPQKFRPVMPKEEPKERKPKVLVVGLRQDIASMIKNEYGKVLDIEAPAHEHNANISPRLVTLAKHADKTFVMLNFVGHQATAMFKSADVEVSYVNGATTDLRRLLNATAKISPMAAAFDKAQPST